MVYFRQEPISYSLYLNICSHSFDNHSLLPGLGFCMLGSFMWVCYIWFNQVSTNTDQSLSLIIMALKTQYQCSLNFYVAFGSLFPYKFCNFRVANCRMYIIQLVQNGCIYTQHINIFLSLFPEQHSITTVYTTFKMYKTLYS